LLSKFYESEANRKLRTGKDEGRKTEEEAKKPEHQTRQHYVRYEGLLVLVWLCIAIQ